jgi:actin related protein 2/3 complex subunit 1A/1B
LFLACVLSKKDKNLYIYSIKKLSDTTSWELVYTLTGHLQYISAVDWHPQTNRIISSSHDRNILVWNLDSSKNIWNPELVFLKVKVSILDVKWSNRGDKFVATTGSRVVATGYYEKENKWWTCKIMKEHKSSVTCARFDASGLFILSGSTDLKAYISSSYMPEIDDMYLNEPKPFELVGKKYFNINII